MKLPSLRQLFTKATNEQLDEMERPSVQQLITKATNEQWDELNLMGMDLSEVPPEIGNLTNLRTLNLSRNRLNDLPESIRNLTNLTSLDIRSNELHVLPEVVGQLTNLAWFKKSRFWVTLHGKFDHHCNDDPSKNSVLRLSSLEALKT